MRVELNVKMFDYEDLPFMNDWLRARGHAPQEIHVLPSIGLVVSEGDFRIAVCFLRRCEGNFGIIDGLATNPEATPELRDVAIDVVVKMVLQEAKEREITNIIAWTVDSNTLVRASERHGFRKLPDTLMAKELADSQTKH